MPDRPSLETILNTAAENRDSDSQWSFVWSTTNIPMADSGLGGRPRRRESGRRYLRRGSLALACLLSMHCRIGASAVSESFFIFILLLAPSVALLANPLRHFEVYLGQWSISGPGRAFRIVPMLDGVGLAICINAIIRAICCVAMASIAAIYVMQGLSDDELPFTYCRDFELNKYDAQKFSFFSDFRNLMDQPNFTQIRRTYEESQVFPKELPKFRTKQFLMCYEEYTNTRYPMLYKTPPYNYFYIEVMKYIPDREWYAPNLNLIFCILCAWAIIWIFMWSEKFYYGKLTWNNVHIYYLIVPWLWVLILIGSSGMSFFLRNKTLRRTLRLKSKDVVNGLWDSLLVSLYVHAASVGTEVVFGKGLNHYALGHIDPKLDVENVWHSVFVTAITFLNSGATTLCALVDHRDSTTEPFQDILKSTIWVLPMYSKCTAYGQYSHLRTTLLFGGLWVSYMAVAYIFLKTALHIIFEYKVKLVYKEQIVVAFLIVICVAVSLVFTVKIGLPLLESVVCIMDSIVMPFICFMELFTLLFMYKGLDFKSDMHVSTEESACSTRISIQWQFIPAITLVLLLGQCYMVTEAEMPTDCMIMALIPLILVIFALPLRGLFNAFRFFKRTTRGTPQHTRGHVPVPKH